jgi:hypothetical protein
MTVRLTSVALMIGPQGSGNTKNVRDSIHRYHVGGTPGSRPMFDYWLPVCGTTNCRRAPPSYVNDEE